MTRAARAPLRVSTGPTAAARLGGGPQTERELFYLVCRRMRALAGGASDLDDLVQLAAEQVFRSLPSFDGRCQLETWVYAVCYRVLLSQRRWYSRLRQRLLGVLGSSDTSPDPTPHELLEESERLDILKRALARMSDKYRAVVVLYHLEEMSTEDIAAIVQCSELTVRSRLRDGRKQLLRLLGRDARHVCVGGFQ